MYCLLLLLPYSYAVAFHCCTALSHHTFTTTTTGGIPRHTRVIGQETHRPVTELNPTPTHSQLPTLPHGTPPHWEPARGLQLATLGGEGLAADCVVLDVASPTGGCVRVSGGPECARLCVWGREVASHDFCHSSGKRLAEDCVAQDMALCVFVCVCDCVCVCT